MMWTQFYDEKVLPLDRSRTKKIALIGKLADTAIMVPVGYVRPMW